MLMAGGIDQDKDLRLSALLLLSAGVFMIEDEEYQHITAPAMFMYGEKEVTPMRANFVNNKAKDTTRAYEHCQSPKFLLVIKGEKPLLLWTNCIRIPGQVWVKKG